MIASASKFPALPSGPPKSPDAGKPFPIIPDYARWLERIPWYKWPDRLACPRRLRPGELTTILNEIKYRGELWGLLGVEPARESGGVFFKLRWRPE